MVAIQVTKETYGAIKENLRNHALTIMIFSTNMIGLKLQYSSHAQRFKSFLVTTPHGPHVFSASALVPHRSTPFHQSMMPIKWESKPF
ncbi:uncharacterized protein LACBIDRAFT_301993 [Laccaria bicolor S238N-H82]|uniref:Predicted protein n=1 Tax=Laccaria bicolor (strain S238N-H82 / ATCC MYA-4686) TaxID=486041 RepID=B0CQB3_LACBS|nr:uncharacterized protein LACBIDRAFT_301993 [Laccaria bicolor S238N-H82]EDR16175.1 predicted protein [Laccaria bicolor S238N-H82]|eukprot:XP_001874383.1 predicted protein [Laccaria bicolor S238N-H82]